MKLKSFLILIIFLLVIGCKEKQNEVKILYNYELDFFTDESVDTPAKISGNEWQTENAELLSIGNEIKSKNSTFPNKIELSFRVFINDKGQVVALKNLSIPRKENASIADEMWLKIGRLLATKNIAPAIKEGKPVNYRKDFKLGFETFNDSLRLYLPDLLTAKNNLKSSNYDRLIEKDFFMTVEQMPEPIGGIRAIAEKVRYPEIAKRAGIEGKVFVKALIDENGNVAGTSIIKGIGAGCDQAAIDAVMHSKFKPGRQRGESVKVQVTIPILFKLQ